MTVVGYAPRALSDLERLADFLAENELEAGYLG